MDKILDNILAGLSKIAGSLSFLEDLSNSKFFGINGYAIFAFLMMAFIVILLFLILFLRSKRLMRRIDAIEYDIDAFREEIKSQLAGLNPGKTPQPPPQANLAGQPEKQSFVDQVLSLPKRRKEMKIREETTGVREVQDSPLAEYAEPTGETGKKEPSIKERVAETSKEKPVIQTKASDDTGKASERDVGELIAGLDDISQPFGSQKVTIGDSSVSWDAKTMLKDNASEVILESSQLEEVRGIELPAKGPKIDLGLDIYDDAKHERTKADLIDKSIDVGSDEISISIDDEPHKEISMEGKLEEKRDSARVLKSADIELVYEGFTDFIKESSVNISQGGMFIKTASLQPLGTKVALNVRLKDGYKLIKGMAEVVRVEEGNPLNPRSLKGFAVKFLDLDPESISLVERIASQKKN